jgi:hypothetical protein
VSFAFGAGGSRTDGVEHPGEELDRYQLQSVVRVQGLTPPGLIAGSHVVRREAEGSRAAVSSELHLSGTLQLRQSTRLREQGALMAAWRNKPGRVALLLTFTHAPAFWALPKEQRSATFLRLPDTSVESDGKRPDLLLKRIVHRLYRATTSPGSEWDYLAYFEMLPTDVAHVRERLGQLRDRRDNKLWTHVKRETELWMVKDLSRHGQPGA